MFVRQISKIVTKLTELDLSKVRSWVFLFLGGSDDLKVLSSHLNWGARLDSFDPLLNTR